MPILIARWDTFATTPIYFPKESIPEKLKRKVTDCVTRYARWTLIAEMVVPVLKKTYGVEIRAPAFVSVCKSAIDRHSYRPASKGGTTGRNHIYIL